MVCQFYHRICGKCGKNVCRAYFPERQPLIKEDLESICLGDNPSEECPIHDDAVTWREERYLKMLAEHCPFASNSYCGQPWLWMCKGHVPPFPLTVVEVDDDGRSLRDEEGGYVYKPKRGLIDIKESCLSGKMEVYEGCPWFKMGVEFREYVKEVKGKKEEKQDE